MIRKNYLSVLLSIAAIVGLSAVSLLDVKQGFGYGGGGGGGGSSYNIYLSSPDGGEIWAAGTTNQVSWTTNTSLITYAALEYSLDGGSTYSTVIISNTPNNGAYLWDIPSTVESNQVKVKIKGYNSGGGLMATDNSSSNFTITQNAVKPNPPTGVMVSNTGTGTQLDINWTNPTGSYDHIRIYRSTIEGDRGTLVYDDVTGTSKSDTGLTTGTTYYYTLSSVNSDGIESDKTDQASGTPTVTNASSIFSYISTDKTSVPADGESVATITVGAHNNSDQPISGMTITLYSSRQEDSMASISAENKVTAVSDSNGEAKFTVKSNQPGISTYSAKVDGVVINQTVNVEFTPTVQPSGNINDYAYQFVSESGNPTIRQGETGTVTLRIRNTGSATWYSTGAHPVRLATEAPPVRDRNSGFYTSGTSWLSENRIAMDQGTVAPGQEATFTVVLNGKPGPGTYPEIYTPVVEFLGWLNTDSNIGWNVTVTGVTYQYEWVEQSAYPTLTPGQTTTLTLKVRNTGNTTWYNTGSFPIHLGTDRPTDRSSMVWNSSWLSANRSAGMSESSVAPGEVATFNFNVQAPTATGTYTEYFRPLAENLTWMNDAGIYWNVIVQ